MSITIEKTGKSIEKAIQAALEELHAHEDEVVIEVLDEGEPGNILGIGRREARVRVSLEEEESPVYYGDDENYLPAGEKSEQEEIALEFVEKVLSEIGVRAAVSSYVQEDTVHVDIAGKDVGALIGRHGETLDALQYLTNIVMNRKGDSHHRLVLDIGGYRKRREETLISLARRTAGKVLKIGKSYEMEPMNAAERRIIHSALQDFQGVTTFSEGEEPDRCVIISPVKE